MSGTSQRPNRLKFRIAHKLALALCVFAFAVSGLVFGVLYQTASSQILSDVRQRLRDVVALAPDAIDPALYARLMESGAEDSDEYRAVRAALRSVRKRSSDIRNIYTMGLDREGRIVILVDAEENPSLIAHMHQVYEDPSEMLREHFATLDGPMVEETYYTDEWGSWLSGYVPFQYGDDHRRGVLGIDISVATVEAYRHRLLVNFLSAFGIALPFLLILGFWGGRKLVTPVLRMGEWAKAVGRGELRERLDIQRKDEIGLLADTLNCMAGSLEQDRSSLRELAARYRNIFDNATEGLFQGHPRGRIVAANATMARILGYGDPEELIAEMDDFIPRVCAVQEDRDRILDALERDGSVEGFRLPFLRRDGSRTWVEFSGHRALQPEGSPLVEGMVVDITQRIEKEQAERERQTAEAASRAKSEFLANMSHEIRTPLNAVMGLSDLLSRTGLDGKQQEYLRKIKISSQSLLAVINDILDFSKIEAGRLDLEETDFSLYEVVANLSEMFAFKASEKDIEFLVSIADGTPCGLRGDPVRLGQVLINLVGNAVKFTSRGEVVVDVRPAATQPPDGQVRIEFRVTDSGIGIDPSRLSNIFDSFTQADGSTTRKYGGTGLGLAICKQLVQLMQGEIRVQSVPGRGSCFSFTALFTPQPSDRQVSLRPPSDLRGLRVLVVDDNMTAREILVSIIESFRMEAYPAASGEEALALIEGTAQPFDLILLDWKMPGLNGIETARRIRRGPGGAPIVCMVSAYGREDLLQQSDRSFLDAFLHKPVNQSLLFDTIMELFGRQSEVTRATPSDADPSAPEIPPHLGGAQVLLVEDNEINQEVAREWLESAGMRVTVAGNGLAALGVLEDMLPDAVLMDIQMPELDGFETTRRLRQQDRFRDLPVIAMTAHALKGDRELCLEAGMNDYVTKPIDPRTLFSTLGRWVRGEERRGASRTPPAAEPASGPPEPEEPFPSSLPGISIQDGLYRANHNRRLYLKLLRSFCRDFSDANSKLAGHLENGRRGEARRLVHSVKGVAGNIGATGLSALAAILEGILVTDTPDPSSPARVDFEQAMDLVIEGLGVHLAAEMPGDKGAGPTAAQPALPALTAAMLLELADLFDEDFASAGSRIEELHPALRALAGEADWARLQEHLEGFEIDEVIDLLRQLAASL